MNSWHARSSACQSAYCSRRFVIGRDQIGLRDLHRRLRTTLRLRLRLRLMVSLGRELSV